MQLSLRSLFSRRRFGLFMSIGVVGLAVETTLFMALNVGFNTAPMVAKLVGAEVSITAMFVLNDRVTFSPMGSDELVDVVARWARSNLVRSGGIAIALGILWTLTEQTDIQVVVSGLHMWPTIANVFAIGVSATVNYVFESIFTWNVGKH